MDGLLQAACCGLPIEAVQIVGRSKKPIKEVHHIAVALGAEKVLREKSPGPFYTQTVGNIIFQSQARLERKFFLRGIILYAEAGVKHQTLQNLIVADKT